MCLTNEIVPNQAHCSEKGDDSSESGQKQELDTTPAAPKERTRHEPSRDDMRARRA